MCNKKKPRICFSLTFLFLLAGCDQTVYFQPESASIPEQVRLELQATEIDSAYYHFNAQEGDTLMIEDSLDQSMNTILILPPDLCVYGNGEPCTGEVEVTFVEIYRKNDMVYSGIPTTASSQALASGGEFYLDLQQNGTPIYIKDGSQFYIKAPISRTKSDSTQMEFYVEEQPETVPFNWSYQGPLADISEGYYTIAYDQLRRWMNCDYLLDQSSTNLQVTVWQEGTAVGDAKVYLISKTANTMVEVNPDIAGSAYSIAAIPGEMEFTIVAIKKYEGRWFIGTQEINPATGNEIDLPMQPVNYNDFKAIINAIN